MPKILILLLLTPLLTLLGGCGGKKNSDMLVNSGYSEAAMDAAIARARNEVDIFIATLENGGGEDYSVKVEVTDGEEIQHVWMTDILYKDGAFTGKIQNGLDTIKDVEIGQTWTVSKEEISDWMFMRDGKMHGNYTIVPLFDTMTAKQADSWRQTMANP